MLAICACSSMRENLLNKAEDTAVEQVRLMDERLAADEFPKSVFPDGTPENRNDGTWWCSGFYAGSLWMSYELTHDPEFRILADKNTHKLDNMLDLDTSHDIGFQVKCTFLNAYRLTGDTGYLAVIEGAAAKLARRYSRTTRTIRSWHHQISGKNWVFPVIIDNMMNLELLMEASKLFECDSLKEIAVAHADRTMEEHFRPDYTAYHVVDYDPNDGHVRARCNHQGYADWSAWSRGQGWALYGYTMMYRETGYERYLRQAVGIADMLLQRLPEDGIPYWDFDDPAIPRAYKDASAAAVMSSAFFELSTLVTDKTRSKSFFSIAYKQLLSLSGPKYLANAGDNCNFILKHSVGNLPGNSEVDVPLTYADYYYLEALVRYRKITGKLGR